MTATSAADERPDPDALLERVREGERKATRGRLRIYFGASPGVGKTYAMLAAARRLRADGRDVVVGIVETHGRSETAALVGGDGADGAALEVVPRRRVEAAGRAIDEFDLDAVLARRPQLVLVDELAHSNAPGSRHPKRWQDVDELLAAGIDVFTTINVQHLESLNDAVGGITGIRVFETVPDTFFDAADEIVLADLSAEELLARLKAGKVYFPEQAERAAANFFRKGNLIALREIALRRTADRVDDDVQAYREERAIDRVWKTGGTLLCCIGPGAGSERVVRAAARLAGQVDVAWHAIHVETSRLQQRSSDARERVLRIVRLADQLGATTAVLPGDDLADAVVRYARDHNLSRIVVGRGSPRDTFARRLVAGESLVDAIGARAAELDLVVVGENAPARVEAETPAPATSDVDAPLDRDVAKRRRVRVAYAQSALACAACTAVAFPLQDVMHPTNVAMTYLLVVALVAMRLGRGPAALASVLSLASFDFFFVPPRYSFAVSDVQYVVTFAVMLAIAFIVGTQGSRLRYQARVAAHREDRMRALYEVARDLSKALRTDDVIEIARGAVGALFEAEAHVLVPRDGASGDRAASSLAIDDALLRSNGFEPAIAQWTYQHGQAAGAGTDTLPASAWIFLPLQTPIRARGVLAVKPRRRRLLLIPEQRRLLETLAALVATALERVHAVDVARDATVHMESERLRNSILSAISHDLRTPLAAMSGLAETLLLRMDARPVPPDDEPRQLAASMRDEARRTSTMVENLLDMARLESGDVRLRRDWHAIEELVGSTLASTRRLLAGHRVRTDVPRDLPLVDVDGVLMERLLYNLVENASKYSPPGSTVVVAARALPRDVELVVEDDGPGLPEALDTPQRIDTLFDKFTRGRAGDETSSRGVGLGLAIARAIAAAHGGTIRAERGALGGARFVVRLPRREPPAVQSEDGDDRIDSVAGFEANATDAA